MLRILAAPVDAAALAGSPAQWAVLAAVVLTILAPRLLPPLARFGTRLLEREIRRRLGLSERHAPTPRRARTSDAEVLPPPNPHPTLRQSNVPLPVPGEPARHRRVWPVVTLFVGAIAVLMWLLLHSR